MKSEIIKAIKDRVDAGYLVHVVLSEDGETYVLVAETEGTVVESFGALESL